MELEQFYKQSIKVLFRSDPSRRQGVKEDLEFFQVDLKRVLQVRDYVARNIKYMIESLSCPLLQIYFDYLERWVEVSGGHMLEEEWRNIKRTCSNIPRGEETAGRKF